MGFDDSRIAARPMPSRKPHAITAAVIHSVSSSPRMIDPVAK